VPPNGSLIVDLGGPALAVFNLNGKFHVLENACPHQGGSLGGGKLEGSVVVCPMHQWKFDVPTGKGLSIPGPCARRFSAVVLGGDVYVGI
jgi:nitrite reductase/ring-hydroxylating ferredoxin subunit